MTDEQIKQNAEAYAEQHAVRIDGGGWEEEYDYEEQENAYIAGAHSRDKEIKELLEKNAEYFKLAEYWKKRASRLKNRLTKKGEQIAKLKKGE